MGLGDLKLIAATLAVLSDKRRRQRIGEERLAAYLATRLSGAVKSRLACEMLSLVEYDPESLSVAKPLCGLNEPTLSRVFREEPFGSARQVISLWLLHGTDRLRSRLLMPNKGYGWRALLRLMAQLKLPLISHYIVRMGLSRCRESLTIPYVSLAKFADQRPILRTSENDIPRPTLIGSYPSFAYDMHTRIGRRAIKMFEINFTSQLRILGVRDVGNLVFALEGGVLDEQVTGCGASDIHQIATRLEVFEQRRPGSDIADPFANFSSILNEFRRRAAVSD